MNLSEKAGLGVTQSNPLRRMHFSKYQASSAALGWPDIWNFGTFLQVLTSLFSLFWKRGYVDVWCASMHKKVGVLVNWVIPAIKVLSLKLSYGCATTTVKPTAVYVTSSPPPSPLHSLNPHPGCLPHCWCNRSTWSRTASNSVVSLASFSVFQTWRPTFN